jgi:signal peptidase I
MGEPPPDHSAPDPADPQSFGAIAQPAAAGEQAAAEPAKRPRVHPIVELVLVLALAFGLAYVVQGWVVKPYRIPSASMEPTLQIGDMVLVNRFIYHFHPPRRGDIIVFHPPGHGDTPIPHATSEAGVNYIKRVIGLPGETIEMRHGTVLVRAPHSPWHALHESYIASNSPKSGPGSRFGPDKIPMGDYFVLGDNRGNSDDSRIWGPLPRRNIIGKAFLIYWPLNRITTL